MSRSCGHVTKISDFCNEVNDFSIRPPPTTVRVKQSGLYLGLSIFSFKTLMMREGVK